MCLLDKKEMIFWYLICFLKKKENLFIRIYVMNIFICLIGRKSCRDLYKNVFIV